MEDNDEDEEEDGDVAANDTGELEHEESGGDLLLQASNELPQTKKRFDEDSDEVAGEEILYEPPGNNGPVGASSSSVSTRNIHAVNIVKRVKEKLEGLDGTSQPMSISQQVDWVIKEATSTDNLCKMYEGWTPWI